MKDLLLVFVKVITLLVGIAMLIGGGFCSALLPFIGSSSETQTLLPLVFITVVVAGTLIAVTLKLPFLQQAKYLALLTGGLFLVGGGLCSGNSSSQISGAFLINFAVTLLGYLLIRWMLLKKNKPPHE